STAAYQGFGLGFDRKAISLLGELATLGISPQLTILLDIGVREGLKRIRRDKDRIERRSLDYHRRVRAGYLKIAKDDPKRIKIVKVKTIGETQREIRRLIEKLLSRRAVNW
ncbi:dTMP kinase, partial [bacterium]